MTEKEHRFREHLGVTDERGGCLSALLSTLAIVAIVVWATMLTGCKTVKVGQSHDKDSVRVEYRIDSFMHVIRDSVRIQLPCSDSIEVAYVDRWHTEYKDRTLKVHDTIKVCSIDTIYQPYPVKEVVTNNSRFARFCIWHTIVVWIIILLASAICFMRTHRTK